MSKSLVKSNGYKTLLSKVRKTLVEGQQRIERERVRTYWPIGSLREAGRVIRADILNHKDRAGYGEQVVLRLARDLSVDRSVLNRCVRFAEVYPRAPIGATWHQFSWSHYRELMTIPDDEKRSRFEKMVLRNDWSVHELAARIRGSSIFSAGSRQAVEPPRGKPLTPLRGTLYTYQIVKRPSVSADTIPELRVDLGFGVFHKVDSRLLSGFSDGNIVESRPKEDAYKFYKGGRTAKDLYTYAVEIEKLIDGDTLKVRFDLGFNVEVRETLRLRGIDCPEMDIKAGQAAKVFVQSYLKEAQTVIVRSSRSDKYDRYLADVYIPKVKVPTRRRIFTSITCSWSTGTR